MRMVANLVRPSSIVIRVSKCQIFCVDRILLDFFAQKMRDSRQNQIAAKQRESCFMEVYGKRKCTFSDYTPKLFVHGSKTCAITKELAPFAYFTPKLRVKFSKFCANNKKLHLFQIFLQSCALTAQKFAQHF